MALKKITDADLAGKGVAPLPDVPGLPAAEMKAKFEEIVREVVIPAVNEHAEAAYDKAEVETRINAAVLAAGAADMAKATYDPRGKAADVFRAANVDLSGYVKPAGTAALAAGDSVAAALGKLEAAGEEKMPRTDGLDKATYDAANGARQVQFETDARLAAGDKTVPGAINKLAGMALDARLYGTPGETQDGWAYAGVNGSSEALYKPHYTKLFSYTTLPASDAAQAIGVAGVENANILYGADTVCRVGGSTRLSIPYYNGTNFIAAYINGANFHFAYNWSTASFTGGSVRVGYTKSTDTAMTRAEILAGM